MDDREKKPWGEAAFGADVKIVKTRLKTGDYTIEGMDKLFVVERKRNWQELYMNSVGKYRESFIRMLRRLREFPFAFMIIEDSFDTLFTFRTWSGLSIDRGLLLNMVVNIQLEYGVQVMTVGKAPRCYPIVGAIFRKAIDFNFNGRLYDGSQP